MRRSLKRACEAPGVIAAYGSTGHAPAASSPAAPSGGIGQSRRHHLLEPNGAGQAHQVAKKGGHSAVAARKGPPEGRPQWRPGKPKEKKKPPPPELNLAFS